jgi:hypothetical protein
MSQKPSFFTCRSCHKEQNLDQSVNIVEDYCVSCYNKEQIWQEVMEKFKAFKHYLKDHDKYTKIRRKKIKLLKILSEMLLPQSIFILEVGEVEDMLHDIQRSAFKRAILSLQDKYSFQINEKAITFELVQKLRPIFEYSRYSTERKEVLSSHLTPFIDNPIHDLSSFFHDMTEKANSPAFTRSNGNYELIPVNPFQFNDSYLLKTVESYAKQIEKASSQPERFKHFVQFVGKDCQFQTIDDMLKQSIQRYAQSFFKSRIITFSERIMREINQTEQSHLIPNIAKYIMDNAAFVFETWYTKILPFDKSRIMISQAKTGSRTDFVVRLQYTFRSYEIRAIEQSLKDTIELLLRGKTDRKIKKISSKEDLSAEEKEKKIDREEERLRKNLLHENLEMQKQKAGASAPMVARFLLLNGEKAFNFILDEVIRYHYKRLKITTEVSYITNVLESGATEKRKNLKAHYLIQSREW